MGRFNRHVQSIAPMGWHRDWSYPLAWLWSRCLKTVADRERWRPPRTIAGIS